MNSFNLCFHFCVAVKLEDVMYYENYDLVNIETPVKAEIFRDLLVESGYDGKEVDYLYQAFSKGFTLEFEGELLGVRCWLRSKTTDLLDHLKKYPSKITFSHQWV